MDASTKTEKRSQHELINWQQLYVICENWESDLEFFENEIGFFRELMGRYFFILLEDYGKIRTLSEGLDALESERQVILNDLKHHMRHLRDLYSSPFVMADQAYLEEHKKLEAAFANYVKRFRRGKKVLFRNMEVVLRSEKYKHMISLR